MPNSNGYKLFQDLGNVNTFQVTDIFVLTRNPNTANSQDYNCTYQDLQASLVIPVNHISGLGTNVGTFLATPSSANLAAAVTGETGTGALVFGTSPTLITPAFTGVPTGTITSGTYTPTLTNTANIAASTAQVCQYLRVGNVVTVSGRIDITPTAAAPTTTVLKISLPIASNIGNNFDACGTGVSGITGAFQMYGSLSGSGATDTIDLAFQATTTSALPWFFTFTYQII